MFEGIALWAGGILVGVIATRLLPGWFRNALAALRKEAKAKAAEYLKDPEWKAIVSQIVLKVQKEAGTEDNIKKLRKATNWIKRSIPTNLDDIIVDAMVELVIEEIKKPIEL
jgi:hypothetical protein